VDEAEGAEVRVVPGVSVTLRLSIRSTGVRRDTQCAPTWHANYQGSLPHAVDLHRSCVGLGRLVQVLTVQNLAQVHRKPTGDLVPF
jgi:hypothetical protein